MAFNTVSSAIPIEIDSPLLCMNSHVTVSANDQLASHYSILWSLPDTYILDEGEADIAGAPKIVGSNTGNSVVLALDHSAEPFVLRAYVTADEDWCTYAVEQDVVLEPKPCK